MVAPALIQTQIWKTNAELLELVEREVEQYNAISLQGRMYSLIDNRQKHYGVIHIAHDSLHTLDVVVMVRIVDDKIIIEKDTSEKTLCEALIHNASISREQIILAYLGETVA